ncbi:hypothetical protein SAMN05444001_1255 [Parabacteroides chinchillae]|uniref:Uncharacterized protein n=1 Tax=Parabacteroides chinchillae TaxID=871327 RepID=A0A8G2BZ01_9BACT|nr:hypothetical protein SAMN05444001_1255 [Parabacteroides chinchillae]
MPDEFNFVAEANIDGLASLKNNFPPPIFVCIKTNPYLCRNFEEKVSMTIKTYKDDPKFFSAYMTDYEAYFFILQDYNLVI